MSRPFPIVVVRLRSMPESCHHGARGRHFGSSPAGSIAHHLVHRDCTSAAAVAAGAGCHGSLLINWVTSCRTDVFPTWHFATRSRTGSARQHCKPVSASSPLIGLLTSMGGANGDCLLPVSGRVGVPRIWSPVSCLVLVI